MTKRALDVWMIWMVAVTELLTSYAAWQAFIHGRALWAGFMAVSFTILAALARPNAQTVKDEIDHGATLRSRSGYHPRRR